MIAFSVILDYFSGILAISKFELNEFRSNDRSFYRTGTVLQVSNATVLSLLSDRLTPAVKGTGRLASLGNRVPGIPR